MAKSTKKTNKSKSNCPVEIVFFRKRYSFAKVGPRFYNIMILQVFSLKLNRLLAKISLLQSYPQINFKSVQFPPASHFYRHSLLPHPLLCSLLVKLCD